ncbi:hypothetical protein BMR05_00660 [Methylococcaceae bacterium HT4]|nr:hypothetical protein BMR05_00660 [Methylococcaceae bacterium HT4]TXL19555.1 hypothetical protein BMR06_09535 [Methylococcaceae bacterium HT5]
MLETAFNLARKALNNDRFGFNLFLLLKSGHKQFLRFSLSSDYALGSAAMHQDCLDAWNPEKPRVNSGLKSALH